MSKTSRDKGLRVERLMIGLLADHHIEAERVPLSGAAGGSFSGDILIEGELLAEVKARKDGTGFALIYRWLGEDNDMLLLKQDRKEPLVVLPLHKLVKVANVLGRGLSYGDRD